MGFCYNYYESYAILLIGGNMIVHKYIRDFENMGLGMYVHFGVYSVIGEGEWAMYQQKITVEEYQKIAKEFCPAPDWAKDVVSVAKAGGCKYITLTTRHHDGYSLYDTCGLSAYDAPHYIRRDLVREFVDACNEEGILPCFYHTALDWYHPLYQNDFPAYLKYLRASVECLCKNYGKIGGIEFDGIWDKWDEDWELDELYGLIRRLQPEAMIINNTGLSRAGEATHPEIDSVTFERTRPSVVKQDGIKYRASEMAEIFGAHWGYSKNDCCFKAPADIIKTFCRCRRYGANLLLNVGPTEKGYVSNIDRAFYEIVGKWIHTYEEAIRDPRPSGIEVENKADDFILKNGNTYYLFCHDVGMSGNPNVWRANREADYVDVFSLPENEKIISAKWMDDDSDVNFSEVDGKIHLETLPYFYGRHLVIRVAKIIVE